MRNEYIVSKTALRRNRLGDLYVNNGIILKQTLNFRGLEYKFDCCSRVEYQFF